MIRQALSVVIVMLSGMQIAYAQSITVRGNVRDDVEPLMGVTVQAKGTTKAVATDLDGNYTISVPDKNAVLVFSYVGYQKQEVKVGDKTVVNVVLQGDAQLLDEVVVVGYGSVKKSDVTGAIASIRPDEMDASKSVTLDNLLQGKVAGLVVGRAFVRDCGRAFPVCRWECWAFPSAPSCCGTRSAGAWPLRRG